MFNICILQLLLSATRVEGCFCVFCTLFKAEFVLFFGTTAHDYKAEWVSGKCHCTGTLKGITYVSQFRGKMELKESLGCPLASAVAGMKFDFQVT